MSTEAPVISNDNNNHGIITVRNVSYPTIINLGTNKKKNAETRNIQRQEPHFQSFRVEPVARGRESQPNQSGRPRVFILSQDTLGDKLLQLRTILNLVLKIIGQHVLLQLFGLGLQSRGGGGGGEDVSYRYR